MSDPSRPACPECGTALDPLRAVCECSERLARAMGAHSPLRLGRRLLLLEQVVAGLVSAEQRRRTRKQRKQRKIAGKTPRDTYAAPAD